MHTLCLHGQREHIERLARFNQFLLVIKTGKVQPISTSDAFHYDLLQRKCVTVWYYRTVYKVKKKYHRLIHLVNQHTRLLD